MTAQLVCGVEAQLRGGEQAWRCYVAGAQLSPAAVALLSAPVVLASQVTASGAGDAGMDAILLEKVEFVSFGRAAPPPPPPPLLPRPQPAAQSVPP